MIFYDNHKNVLVESGQDVWDIVLQEYGDVAEIFRLLSDNPALTIDSSLVPLMPLSIQIKVSGASRQTVLDFFRTNAIKVNTHDYFTDSCYLLQENGDAILQENNSHILVC